MSYQIRIYSRNDLSSSVIDEFEQRFQDNFGHSAVQWATTPDWFVSATHREMIVGSLQLFKRSISVGEAPITVGGIGGVVTNPEWRGRGVASAMLKTSGDFIRDDMGVDFGLLLCVKKVAPVYVKSGWFLVAGPTMFDQPNGKAVYPQHTMILSCNNKQWPDGEIDLCGLPW